MNIPYHSSAIEQYYSRHRTRWTEFYPSEQFVFERVAADRGGFGSVLDVGGAVGGLGRALAERFRLEHYTCIDINAPAIRAARQQQSTYPVPSEFICADVVNQAAEVGHRKFDVVACLSCADWNLQPEETIGACWRHVMPGGCLVISLRLTDGPTVNDMQRSFQYIHFDGTPVPAGAERANYVVLNVHDALASLNRLTPPPSRLLAYGYWGRPSATAVTVYERVAFSVLALTQGRGGGPPAAELQLPLDLLLRS